MSDKRAKCARRKCGWIGMESQMRNVVVKTTPLKITELHCPRCDGNEFYYKLKENEAEKPKSGAQLIANERDRQIKIKGFTNDDHHTLGELSSAAGAYLLVASAEVRGSQASEWPWEMVCSSSELMLSWPWRKTFWKPSDDPIRNLVKAGALIAAEIDRL